MSARCTSDHTAWNSASHAGMLEEARIGGDASIDIVGHVAVVSPSSSGEVLACGVIEQN